MLVWLVFDSRHDDGLGHVSRLVAISQHLRSKGIKYCFHDENSSPAFVIDFINRNNLVAVCRCLDKPNLVIVDTYNEMVVNKFSVLCEAPVVVFSDEFTPTVGAQAIVEVSPISARKLYQSNVPVLKFQESPLLRDEIVNHKKVPAGLNTDRENWLVTLGGVDESTFKFVLDTLKTVLANQQLNITVASHSSVVGAFAISLGFKWINHSLDISAICDNFESAITGAGVTAWELAYLQLPGFVIGVVANQDFQLEYLVEHKVRLGVQLSDKNFKVKLSELFSTNYSHSQNIYPKDGRDRVYEFIKNFI